METNQRTIASEQTIVFDGSFEEVPKPFLLKFLTPVVVKGSVRHGTDTGTWSTGDDDGADYLDT